MGCFGSRDRDDPSVTTFLTLGGHYSGKTTFIRHLQLAYEHFDSKESRLALISYIRMTIVAHVQTILQTVKDYNVIYPGALGKSNLEALSRLELNSENPNMLSSDALRNFNALLSAGVLSEILTKTNYVFDPTDIAYLASQSNRIFDHTYIPSEADILRINWRNTGITQWDLPVGTTHTMRFIDVGGHLLERKKWRTTYKTHKFDRIVFIVALDCFYQPMVEDQSGNRMQDSLELFETICSEPMFHRTPIILIFNKADVFKDALRRHFVDFQTLFPDYHRDADPTAALEYLYHRFLHIHHQTRHKVLSELDAARQQRPAAVTVRSGRTGTVAPLVGGRGGRTAVSAAASAAATTTTTATVGTTAGGGTGGGGGGGGGGTTTAATAATMGLYTAGANAGGGGGGGGGGSTSKTSSTLLRPRPGTSTRVTGTGTTATATATAAASPSDRPPHLGLRRPPPLSLRITGGSAAGGGGTVGSAGTTVMSATSAGTVVFGGSDGGGGRASSLPMAVAAGSVAGIGSGTVGGMDYHRYSLPQHLLLQQGIGHGSSQHDLHATNAPHPMGGGGGARVRRHSGSGPKTPISPNSPPDRDRLDRERDLLDRDRDRDRGDRAPGADRDRELHEVKEELGLGLGLADRFRTSNVATTANATGVGVNMAATTVAVAPTAAQPSLPGTVGGAGTEAVVSLMTTTAQVDHRDYKHVGSAGSGGMALESKHADLHGESAVAAGSIGNSIRASTATTMMAPTVPTNTINMSSVVAATATAAVLSVSAPVGLAPLVIGGGSGVGVSKLEPIAGSISMSAAQSPSPVAGMTASPEPIAVPSAVGIAAAAAVTATTAIAIPSLGNAGGGSGSLGGSVIGTRAGRGGGSGSTPFDLSSRSTNSPQLTGTGGAGGGLGTAGSLLADPPGAPSAGPVAATVLIRSTPSQSRRLIISARAAAAVATAPGTGTAPVATATGAGGTPVGGSSRTFHFGIGSPLTSAAVVGAGPSGVPATSPSSLKRQSYQPSSHVTVVHHRTLQPTTEQPAAPSPVVEAAAPVATNTVSTAVTMVAAATGTPFTPLAVETGPVVAPPVGVAVGPVGTSHAAVSTGTVALPTEHPMGTGAVVVPSMSVSAPAPVTGVPTPTPTKEVKDRDAYRTGRSRSARTERTPVRTIAATAGLLPLTSTPVVATGSAPATSTAAAVTTTTSVPIGSTPAIVGGTGLGLAGRAGTASSPVPGVSRALTSTRTLATGAAGTTTAAAAGTPAAADAVPVLVGPTANSDPASPSLDMGSKLHHARTASLPQGAIPASGVGAAGSGGGSVGIATRHIGSVPVPGGGGGGGGDRDRAGAWMDRDRDRWDDNMSQSMATATATALGRGDGSLFEITHNPDFNILHYASLSNFGTALNRTAGTGRGGAQAHGPAVGHVKVTNPHRGGLGGGVHSVTSKADQRSTAIAALLTVLVMSAHDLEASPIKHLLDETLFCKARGGAVSDV